MRKYLHRFYNALQRALAPGLRNSQFAYKEALVAHSRPGIVWLDLGCGHQILPEWMPSSQQDEADLLRRPRLFIGIDADAPSLRKNNLVRRLVAGNIEALPFRDQTFDLITANMVIEHIESPAELLREVHRVLRAGGEFLFHTPNSQGYTTLTARALPQRAKIWFVHFLQGREEGDVFPTFYRLNSPAAIESLALQSGFEVDRLSLEESSAQTVMLGPLVILELLLIRALRWDFLRRFRTNLIIVLRKPVLPA
ncbi:MAG TPA: class I SAM-dependent methyltransferase [Candidatus Acidoferrum sp.]|nr:class I SAM-dependent methyltransferase [Candidatus Acidoferrum sp.]